MIGQDFMDILSSTGASVATTSDGSLWSSIGQSFSDMTKNVVTNLISVVPNIAVSTLAQVTQAKLVDAFGVPSSEEREKAAQEVKVIERVVEKQAAAPTTKSQPQTIVMQAAGDWQKYAPWLIGGGVVLGGVYLITKGKKK